MSIGILVKKMTIYRFYTNLAVAAVHDTLFLVSV